MKNKRSYDPKIMAELLSQPEIKKEVEKMHPEILSWYKDLLVSEGIYAKYCRERK
ncbi:MAG: hypothetical protein ABFD51_13110 [Anaerolineaceae bacterium]